MKPFGNLASIVGLAVFATTGLANAAVPLKIAVTPGPMADIIQHAADLAAKQGLPVKVVVFSDWMTPNVAVADGDVDANFYEHKPYLAVADATQHFNLVAVAPGVIMPMGLFSHKLKNLADIPYGAQVAVANDPINRGRGLELYQKAGLITLKPGVGDFATVADITSNPKHLHFIELEAPQLVRALDDVEVAQVSFTFLLASGGDPNSALITDGSRNLHYAIQIVARPAEAKDPRLLKFITIFQSPDEKAFILSRYHGFFTPAW
ncbi:MetQ/NlpA family ABC transporter substrate-binding protein [Acidocella sp.]|jgi:D-methionine transport system substrate-binding protein|uniref:MetQ/NlpA family ABC transporter substrate-binding protein n=1 Tax=Acidocella sp. TaxID=50710 RepID=UPI002F3EA261